MIEKETEDLMEKYPQEFFPRKVLKFKGRQGVFAGVGRYDLLFEDEFNNHILMELKAVPAKSAVADQLVKYKEAFDEKGVQNVMMWLVAPLISKSIADFLDRFGIEHAQIHEAEFRCVAARHGYSFESEVLPLNERSVTTVARKPEDSSKPLNSTWRFNSTRANGSEREFLDRCDGDGKTIFTALFEKQKSMPQKTKITWNHESGFSLQFYFHRLGFVEMIWGFPSMNREGKPRKQNIVFPFDFAHKKGVSEVLINDFGAAVSAIVPLTGGVKRPQIAVSDIPFDKKEFLVDTFFEFARRVANEV